MGWLRTIRRGVTLVTVGVAGGAAVVTVRHLLRSPQPLESALHGETHIDRKHGGDVFYNVAGPAEGRAMVLLHDFYPGASNFEFRAVFEPLSHDARVYAPDWLGFGMSERPNLAYTGEFYASTLAGFLRDVVGRPATVVAHGLAANVAVRAASDAPQFFERLVLVSPALTAGEGEEPTVTQTVAQTAHRFWLGLVPYALISTRPALKRLAGGATADEERVDHLYASTHQFGGHYAALALLSGELDLPIRNALPLLEPPLLLVSGEQDPQRPREAMEDLAVLSPHADLDVIARAGELVFEDEPGAFVAAVTSWMGTPAERYLLDESALLPAVGDVPTNDEDQADDEDAADAASDELADNADEASELSDELADNAAEAQDVDEAQDADADEAPVEDEAQETEKDEPLVGTPGYVVPGVSDMGLDGPAAVTVNGVANIAPDASGVADDDVAEGGADEDDDSASALLPEAGASGPAQDTDDAVENIADAAAEHGADDDAADTADEAVENVADEVVSEREETPTAPRRAVRANAVGAVESSAAVPELRTTTASRSAGRAVSARGTNVRRQTSPKGSATRSVGGQRATGGANGRKGGTSRNNVGKNGGRTGRNGSAE